MQMDVTTDAPTVDERRQMAVASHADACDEMNACRWKHVHTKCTRLGTGIVHADASTRLGPGIVHADARTGIVHADASTGALKVHSRAMSHMAQGVRGMWHMSEGHLT